MCVVDCFLNLSLSLSLCVCVCVICVLGHGFVEFKCRYCCEPAVVSEGASQTDREGGREGNTRGGLCDSPCQSLPLCAFCVCSGSALARLTSATNAVSKTQHSTAQLSPARHKERL